MKTIQRIKVGDKVIRKGDQFSWFTVMNVDQDVCKLEFGASKRYAGCFSIQSLKKIK